MKFKLRYLIFAFIILGFIVRAHTMQDIFFWPWDEGIYAEVADEILINKSLNTTFNNGIWLNKPPLAHALVAGSFLLFENRELGARLLMVIFSSLLLILTYMLAEKTLRFFFSKEFEDLPLWEKEIVPMIPVLMTASTFLFLERSTLINTDVMLGVAWVGYFLTRGSYIGKLFFISFGTLTKSFLGLYPLGFELLMLRKGSISLKGLMKGIALLVIPLVWHIYSYILHGQYFINSHVLDQVVKRVTDPIELHFGGRLYYPLLAWENFSFFMVLIAIAYIIVLWSLWKDLRLRGIGKYLGSETWFNYLILFSALPFFTFLMFVQSKITWYFATLLPLLTIPVAHLYMKMKHKRARMLILVAIFGFFLYRYIPETYALNVSDYVPSERIQLALCINHLPGDEVGVLVNEEERRNRNTIEAAQQQTETSFIYGGSSSFVYYTHKKVRYSYDPVAFTDSINVHKIVAVYQDDRENVEYEELSTALESYSRVENCTIGKWEVYIK